MNRTTGREGPRPAGRGLIIGAALLVFLVVWVAFAPVAQVVFVTFAAMLVAVLLDALTRGILRFLPIGRIAALVLVTLLVLGLATGFGLLTGPRFVDETTLLIDRLPSAVDQIESAARETRWGKLLLHQVPPARTLLQPSGSVLLGRAQVVASTLAGVLTTILFVFLIGLYVAVNPALYVRGFLHLVPRRHRRRAREVVAALGHALRWWLLGRLGSMVAVGLLTGIGLWLFGIQLPLALGVIAGLFSFVPFVGSIAAAVPALLIGLGQGLTGVLQVLLVFGAAQFLEGNFITPIIQERAVSLPPALLLTSQFILGVLFGLVGLLLATPFTVALMILVEKLYVEGTLGDHVHVLERKGA